MFQPDLAQKIDEAVLVMFDDPQQRKYFTELFNRHPDIIGLHIKAGLWDEKDQKPYHKANITGHCGLVAARSHILAWKLGLAFDIQMLAERAGLIHDVTKMFEIDHAMAHGKTWDSFAVGIKIGETFLRKENVDPTLMRIGGSCGHGGFLAMQAIMQQSDKSDEDILRLIVSYVDDFTRHQQPVAPVVDEKNDLNRRIEKNMGNEDYKLLDEGAKDYFGGKTMSQFQIEIGIAKQNFLARRWMYVHDCDFDPKRLPEMIETELEKEIKAAA